MKVADQVTIYEVGLRDGLQLESKVLTVDEKVEIFSLLQKANVSQIEFGSFVHPKLVPQMANTAAFYEHLKSYPELSLVALVPNLKGLELAKQTGVKSVNYVFSASNTHNEQNVRQTTEQSLENFKYLSQFASDNEINFNVTVATSFGCPFEGPVPRQRIMNLIEQLLLHNIKRITLADTTGMANPKQVYQLTKEVVNEWNNVEFGCHFHNTRGMGLSNILAGLEAGITVFDASLGGIGGCPFAPGATGNVCTEDVVHMLEEMGVRTSINLDGLIEASHRLGELLEHDLPGQVAKAGKSSRLYPVPNKTTSSLC
ncbi:hydroxymethylglutaryl-CoA lyase [Neobacillus sp. SAB-20_R2A]|uniref:hydroxymethylglutaryl-CoA lyase n=1 Tax=Neobacillus sp. SAB-20_R2A TaxID=3120519 RepID=UPI003C6E0578